MVTAAFSLDGITMKIENILPVKALKPSTKRTKKYRQIYASIKEVGIIEHLVVYPQKGQSGHFLLLDGHMRLEVLKDMKMKEAPCIISTDDEGYTYNHKINKLSSIQEHFMILKAIEKGVSEDRIAVALNVNIARIREKRDLLNGISPEAIEILKNKRISPKAINEIRKMKPMRQIEVAELMMAANNYTVPYAKALLIATPSNQLIKQKKTPKTDELSIEDAARMEQESEKLERDFIVIKDSYGKNNLNLVLATGYLSKLLDNVKVVKFLSKNHPGILSEFQAIAEATSLGTR